MSRQQAAARTASSATAAAVAMPMMMPGAMVNGRFLRRIGGWFVAALYGIGGMYYLLLSPPLHLFYEPLPPAGNSSVYVPGGGFSGFWYHLGLLQNTPNLDDHHYYCYSSGCLSLVLAYMNTTVDTVFDASYDIQKRWVDGELTRYQLVENFVDQLMPRDDFDLIEPFLPRMNVLVTTANEGAAAMTAVDHDSLVDLMVKTTWIPMVTGDGIMTQERDDSGGEKSNGNMYIDGGFSRALHPECERTIKVPVTWDTFIHSLNPGFGRSTARGLWDIGRRSTAAFAAAPASHFLT